MITRNKYGTEAEFVIRELLHSGKMTLYHLIIQVTRNLLKGNFRCFYSVTSERVLIIVVLRLEKQKMRVVSRRHRVFQNILIFRIV